MKYTFDCYQHGDFIVDSPIAIGPPPMVYCKECGEECVRLWETKPVHWNTQGAHQTDYDSRGDKLERLNKSWSRDGSKPPTPARDVPRSGSEPY